MTLRGVAGSSLIHTKLDGFDSGGRRHRSVLVFVFAHKQSQHFEFIAFRRTDLCAP